MRAVGRDRRISGLDSARIGWNTRTRTRAAWGLYGGVVVLVGAGEVVGRAKKAEGGGSSDKGFIRGSLLLPLKSLACCR